MTKKHISPETDGIVHSICVCVCVCVCILLIFVKFLESRYKVFFVFFLNELWKESITNQMVFVFFTSEGA